MYDPALSAFYAWISCSAEVSEPDSICLVLWTCSPLRSDVRPSFSLFAQVFSVGLWTFQNKSKGHFTLSFGRFRVRLRVSASGVASVMI